LLGERTTIGRRSSHDRTFAALLADTDLVLGIGGLIGVNFEVA
jgi:hypothetical protein